MGIVLQYSIFYLYSYPDSLDRECAQFLICIHRLKNNMNPHSDRMISAYRFRPIFWIIQLWYRNWNLEIRKAVAYPIPQKLYVAIDWRITRCGTNHIKPIFNLRVIGLYSGELDHSLSTLWCSISKIIPASFALDKTLESGWMAGFPYYFSRVGCVTNSNLLIFDPYRSSLFCMRGLEFSNSSALPAGSCLYLATKAHELLRIFFPRPQMWMWELLFLFGNRVGKKSFFYTYERITYWSWNRIRPHVFFFIDSSTLVMLHRSEKGNFARYVTVSGVTFFSILHSEAGKCRVEGGVKHFMETRTEFPEFPGPWFKRWEKKSDGDFIILYGLWKCKYTIPSKMFLRRSKLRWQQDKLGRR